MSLSTHRALASESRVRLLRVLRQRGGPVPVDELADAVGLHVNTVREHLDHLVATDLVGRETEVRRTRGRPRVLYTARSGADASVRSATRDHLLRLLLAGFGRGGAAPAELAEASGRAWADELPPAAPGAPDDAAAQLAALEEHLAALGFDPEADAAAPLVRLRRCPVLDLACERADVVCAVHLGLARGVLARVPGPLVVDGLEPVVDPGTEPKGPGDGVARCVLRLRRAPAAPAA